MAAVIPAVPGVTATPLALVSEPLTSGALALAEPELLPHPQALSEHASVEPAASAPAVQPGPRIVPPLAPAVVEQEPEASAASQSPFDTNASPDEPIETTTPSAASDIAVASDAVDSTLDPIRTAVVEALTAGGHATAATLLDEGAWTLDGASVKIAVPVKSTMIRLTFNAAAEKLIRQGLAQSGAPSRFLIIPGEIAAAGNTPRASRAPQGSIDAEARSNPLVLEAQTLFQAEIIAVVDLRT